MNIQKKKGFLELVSKLCKWIDSEYMYLFIEMNLYI